MGVLKTFLYGIIAAGLLASPHPAWALEPLALTFAKCTGRLSAEMEFQWLLGGHSEQIENERDAMLALLDAVSPEEQRRELLHRRIEAKGAQARLLTRSTFNRDEKDANWAKSRAATELGLCRALILG